MPPIQKKAIMRFQDDYGKLIDLSKKDQVDNFLGALEKRVIQKRDKGIIKK